MAMRARVFFLCVAAVVSAAGDCRDHATSQPSATASVAGKGRRRLLAEDARRGLKVYTEEVEPGKLRLSFGNAPAYLQPLEMAPAARETAIERGDWLVLAVAAWSV